MYIALCPAACRYHRNELSIIMYGNGGVGRRSKLISSIASLYVQHNKLDMAALSLMLVCQPRIHAVLEDDS